MQPLEQLDDDALAAALRASRTLEDAPEGAIQRAIALWPAARRPVPVKPAIVGAWARLRAVLAFDSAQQDALALGLRGAVGPQGELVRQWLFTAGEHDIDLRASPSAQLRLWTLSGQILGPQLQGSVTLRRAGASVGDDRGDENVDNSSDDSGTDRTDAAAVQTVALNEWSEFHFDGLEPGAYLLSLNSPEGELELPAVPVGA